MTSRTVLITGANRGIGLEFARQYAELGWRVIATARNPATESLGKLIQQYGGSVSVVPLDVTDDARIRALAHELNGQTLDLLVLNAGVYGQDNDEFGRVDARIWQQTFQVNAIAPLKIMEAFVEHVANSDRKVSGALTRKMGSMTDNRSGGSYVYRSSKAALNAAVKSAAIDLRERAITVLALHPGWVKTDMGGGHALITPKQSVSGLRHIIDNATLAHSGRFYQYDGAEVPW